MICNSGKECDSGMIVEEGMLAPQQDFFEIFALQKFLAMLLHCVH